MCCIRQLCHKARGSGFSPQVHAALHLTIGPQSARRAKSADRSMGGRRGRAGDGRAERQRLVRTVPEWTPVNRENRLAACSSVRSQTMSAARRAQVAVPSWMCGSRRYIGGSSRS
jgi:hypothetical protein